MRDTTNWPDCLIASNVDDKLVMLKEITAVGERETVLKLEMVAPRSCLSSSVTEAFRLAVELEDEESKDVTMATGCGTERIRWRACSGMERPFELRVE